MKLSGYMNSPIESKFISLRHGMEHFMHHPHKPIIYSRNNIFKLNDIPHQLFLKAGSAYINKNTGMIQLNSHIL